MSRHPFDPLAFTAGTLFAGLGLAFLVAGHDVLDGARWIWPLLLVTLGAAGLLAALRPDDDDATRAADGGDEAGTPAASTGH